LSCFPIRHRFFVTTCYCWYSAHVNVFLLLRVSVCPYFSTYNRGLLLFPLGVQQLQHVRVHFVVMRRVCGNRNHHNYHVSAVIV
jgi:hypothetical protein